MTPIQLTDIAAPDSAALSAARDQMINASALQEHIIAAGPVLPSSVRVEKPGGSSRIDVTVYLHRNAWGVEAYQRLLGGVLHREAHSLSDGAPGVNVSLSGVAFGCSFRVWTLVPVGLAVVERAA